MTEMLPAGTTSGDSAIYPPLRRPLIQLRCWATHGHSESHYPQKQTSHWPKEKKIKKTD